MHGTALLLLVVTQLTALQDTAETVINPITSEPIPVYVMTDPQINVYGAAAYLLRELL